MPASGPVLMPIVTDRLGSSTMVTGSGLGSAGSAIVSPIVTSDEPGQGDDLARPGLVGRDAVERLGDVELRRPRGLDRAVGAAPRDRRALAEDSVADPQQREPADVRACVEVRDERLERVPGVVARRRDRLEERVEQRLQVGRQLVRGEPGTPGAGVCVDDRELDLRLVGVEVEKELVDLVDDLFRPRVRPVDLVDDEHDRELLVERLAEHEPRLGKRPLRGVDEQEDAVDHRQRTLDLAAEIGVPGRVDDVDLPSARAAPPCSWRES